MNPDKYINEALAGSAPSILGSGADARPIFSWEGPLLPQGGVSRSHGNSFRNYPLKSQPTMADQIEARLSRLQAEMDRVRSIKAKLSEPNGILSVSVDDLRWITSY